MRRVSGRLWTEFIFLSDYLLVPIYLVVIYLVFSAIRNRFYPVGHPWRRPFTVGFSLKIAGALFISLIYQYYYSGGDTSAFFYHANVINSAASESVYKWFQLLLAAPARYSGDYYEYTSQLMWYGNTSEYFVSALTACVNVITFNTFLPTACIIAAVSFSGNWALFRTFASQYPQHTKNIAIATLFIPSTIVWGSGIFKDTFCLFGLGWMTYSVFQLLIQRNFKIGNFIILILSFYLIVKIKVYIIIAFLPALLLWILFFYSKRIKSRFLRVSLIIGVAGIIGGVFSLLSTSFSSELGSYSLENIAETSEATRNYIFSVSQTSEASAYNLGNIDPSTFGILKKMPAAVNVTLFRPYIWEARNAMVLLNALEATLIFLLTIKVIVSVGLFKVWASITKNPNVQFFLIFSIIFAFAVGISSYNFGALSRYRIPCLPFYVCALILIYYDNKSENNNVFSFNFN